LQSLANLDPEPDDLEQALERLIHEAGPSAGPVRALALAFRDEWQALPASPQWVDFLQTESERQRKRGDSRDRTVQS
jgi:hypothetical protein